MLWFTFFVLKEEYLALPIIPLVIGYLYTPPLILFYLVYEAFNVKSIWYYICSVFFIAVGLSLWLGQNAYSGLSALIVLAMAEYIVFWFFAVKSLEKK